MISRARLVSQTFECIESIAIVLGACGVVAALAVLIGVTL